MMKFLTTSIVFTSLLLLQACTSTKNSTLWVSGIKTECSAGAGKMECLNVYKGNDINNPQWENFYAPIEGFNFEEGFLKKIEVKEEKLDPKNAPADASSIKYTLLKEIEKKPDTRVQVQGDWLLASIDGGPINRMEKLPNISINLSQKSISGSDGCNNFSGTIKNITESKLDLGTLAGTKKMCVKMTTPDQFNKLMSTVSAYKLKSHTLELLDAEGKAVLSFIKYDKNEAMKRLHDIWIATRINGNPINRMTPTPRMELNLTEMTVMGSNSCNDYSGKIEAVSGDELRFGPIAATKKMCRKMDVANEFDKALNSVASYKLEDLNLILLDKDGNEVLSFLKGD
ncbi:MAG: META domain-containing protein [Chitinophagales bacterium]|nr:META domain-containing protein [Bacteroidota bacterium]MCB9042287.1 META domain-containing protein [Chitinophagales bacterium]